MLGPQLTAGIKGKIKISYSMQLIRYFKTIAVLENIWILDNTLVVFENLIKPNSFHGLIFDVILINF